MTDRWQELPALFDALLELDAAGRKARLREIRATDPALFARLEAMLVADDDADAKLRGYEDAAARSVLAAMAGIADEVGVNPVGSEEATGRRAEAADGEAADAADEQPVGRSGQRVGAWELVREIGYGGMGVVYLARRADGHFEQQAAVKLLRYGWATTDVVQRFNSERAILASLQHPHIARLLDGGVAPDRTPWFAMEYVEGAPITEYCTARQLSIEECLELFEQVCRVVQHAHNRLIIHRDLKPSNILVTSGGEPRLLDFGLAKVLQEPSGEVTATRPGRRWMTLEYASPEQVRGQPLATASDTYQLGLILYEMLTGRRAYTVRGLSPGEAESVICEKAPTRPSTVVATADGEAAASHVVRPERLRKRLKGDLDTIILKALHKDPERRYASAETLANDIARHLKGLPIQARPDTLGYRTRKIVQRNRWGVAAAALVFVSLLGGLAGTLWQAQQATQHAHRAIAEQHKAEHVTAFLMGLFEANDPSVAQGDEITARQLLEQGVQSAEALADQPELQATLFGVTARVYESLGNLEQAERLYRRSLAAFEAAPSRQTNDQEYRRALIELGYVLLRLGRYQEAEPFLRQVLEESLTDGVDDAIHLDALLVLFEILHTLGRDEEAVETFAAWDEAGRLLPTSDPDAAGRMLRLAEFLGNQGQIRGDLATIRRGQTLVDRSVSVLEARFGSRHPRVGAALNLKLLLWNQENGVQPLSSEVLARADSLSREVTELHRLLYPEPHDELATSLYFRSNVLRRLRQYEEADAAIREALATLESTRGTGSAQWVVALRQLANITLDRGAFEEAVAQYRQVRDWWAESFGAEYLFTLRADLSLGLALARAGQFEAAEARMTAAYETLEGQRGSGDRYTREALEHLVSLYEAWDRPEQEEQFRSRLTASEVTPPPSHH